MNSISDQVADLFSSYLQEGMTALHKTLVKFGYKYSHSVPVDQPSGGKLHHHTWVHPVGHQCGAYEGSTKFSTKNNAGSGHLFSGVGVKALEKHLSNKAKRYHLEEQKHLPHLDEDIPVVPLTQQLFSGEEKVKAYADYFDKRQPTWNSNPTDSYRTASPAAQLKALWEARDRQVAKFGDPNTPTEDPRNNKGKK
jgi:hypothetical protein